MNPSAPILIAAINARHSHTSMGARCLLANMGELRAQTELAEFTLQQSAAEIAAAIATHAPRILGLGVYIWNAAPLAGRRSWTTPQRISCPVVAGHGGAGD